FKAEVREQGHPWVTVARNTGLSEPNGEFDVSLSPANPIDPYDRLQCRVSTQLASNPSQPKVKYLHPPFANGATIVLNIEEAPAPTNTHVVKGRKADPPERLARMALYRNPGPY